MSEFEFVAAPPITPDPDDIYEGMIVRGTDGFLSFMLVRTDGAGGLETAWMRVEATAGLQLAKIIVQESAKAIAGKHSVDLAPFMGETLN